MFKRRLVCGSVTVFGVVACAAAAATACAAQAGERPDEKGPPVPVLIAELHSRAAGKPEEAAKVLLFDDPSHARKILPPLADAFRQWGRIESLFSERGWGEPQEPLACLLVGLPFMRPDKSSLESAAVSVENDSAEFSSDDGELNYFFRKTADGWKWNGTAQLRLGDEASADHLAVYLDALAAALRGVANDAGEAGDGDEAGAGDDRATSVAANVDRTVCVRLLGPHFKGGGVPAVPAAVKGERRLVDGAGRLSCMAASPDGKVIAAGATHSALPLRLWDLETGKVLPEIKFPPSDLAHVYAVTFSQDGTSLFASGTAVSVGAMLSRLRESGGGDPWEHVTDASAVWQFRSETGQLVRAFERPKFSLLESLAVSPDGRFVASASYTSVMVWDANTGKVIRQLEGGDAVVFRPTGELAARQPPEAITVYDPGSGQKLRTLPLKGNRVERPEGAMAVSPDGKFLAYGTLATVHVINTADGDVITKLMLPNALAGVGRVNSIAFSNDGRRLLAATGLYSLDERKGQAVIPVNRNRDVCLWAVPTGKLLARFDGHAGAVSGAAFTRGEAAVVSSSTDGTLRVWALPNGGR